ncbi:MAG: FAD-dependent oxidoreductase [Acidimicrobiales bacterium]
MNLLSPLDLRHHTARCRVLFGPHETNLGDGRAFSDRHVAYYRARAEGGAGIIVTEEASVHATDWPYERCPDAGLAGPGWAAIAAACRPTGTLVVAALGHSGGQGSSAYSQRELWAPSDEPEVNSREVPKVMEGADIDAVVAGFAQAAATAAGAGLDGVEVNAGQHSLIRQFLSGLTNRRGDGYGTDRVRLAREVLTAVRSALGPDPILGLRLSCDELAPWAGLTPELAADVARELAPLVDYLVVVRGSIFSVAETRPTGHHPEGVNLELAATIRQAVDGAVPVVAQGSIVEADQADEALAAGRCDAVEMTRAQIADPALVAKLRRRETPRPCVLCNQWCRVRDNRNPIVSCIADPRAGHETSDPAEPAGRPPGRDPAAGHPLPRPGLGDSAESGGPLLVVGAGPAGLEAARVAARLGLAVTVWEASPDVGGMARVVARAPGHHRFARLIGWLADDAVAYGVELVTGRSATDDEVAAWPGPVIVATGGRPAPPGFEVAPGAVVLTPEAVLAADDAARAELVPESVVIWDPLGGPIAVGVAEALAWTGRRITVCTPDPIVGTLLSLTGDLPGANVRLQQAGIAIERRVLLRRAAPGTATIEHRFSAERTELEAGAVIDCGHRLPAEGPGPDGGPARAHGPRPVRVGDAVAPRTVGDAIREGRAAALALAPAGRTVAAPAGVGAP